MIITAIVLLALCFVMQIVWRDQISAKAGIIIMLMEIATFLLIIHSITW